MPIVTVEKNRYTVDPLYQWDINQVLEITGLSLPSIPEIHFTNDAMDKAIVRQSTMDAAGIVRVDIPNSFLQKPYKIKAYVCIYDGETFESLYAFDIPVKARNKPSDYTIEGDEEIYSFNALENLVLNTLKKAEATLANEETVIAAAKKAENAAQVAAETARDEVQSIIDNMVDSESDALKKPSSATLVASGLEMSVSDSSMDMEYIVTGLLERGHLYMIVTHDNLNRSYMFYVYHNGFSAENAGNCLYLTDCQGISGAVHQGEKWVGDASSGSYEDEEYIGFYKPGEDTLRQELLNSETTIDIYKLS